VGNRCFVSAVLIIAENPIYLKLLQRATTSFSIFKKLKKGIIQRLHDRVMAVCRKVGGGKSGQQSVRCPMKIARKCYQ
jgi:hypothetical protein